MLAGLQASPARYNRRDKAAAFQGAAMGTHDWTRVASGIFHDFHHEWISEIKRALNRRLPEDYYALAEQHAAGFGPDVLTLQGRPDGSGPPRRNGMPAPAGGGVALAEPRVTLAGVSDRSFTQRRRTTVVVRHVSDDRVVAMVEIVSPGNKGSVTAVRSFVEKAAELILMRVNLLVVDLHPPGPRDPHGLHAAIWEEFAGQESEAPPARPFVLASYDAGLVVRAYMETAAAGDALPEMPLFLDPPLWVGVPLEATYLAAFAEVPLRWRGVLERA